jgi:uncharacterized membrane protein
MMSGIGIFILTISAGSFLVGFALHNLLATMNGMVAGSNVDDDAYISLKVYKNHFLIGAVLLPLIYFGYGAIEKNGLGAHVMEWVNLVVRWAHVVLGISWIGASFYFIFLENSLNRTKDLRDELAGNLWAIHGGGFYYVEKYKSAPDVLPEKLHWFKFEAYYTWITGALLLILVYYMNAKAFMIDPSVREISPATAIGIGIGTIILGWILYDFLCKTPLLHRKKLFALVGFIIITAISFFLSRILSGRAAFMHIGALIGTIMAGNVFFTIIPAQKAMVKAAKENKPLDPNLGKYAGLRSLHNNYMTLPVIFIMISNHFPVTFGSTFNWAVLAGLTLTSVAVRHFINLYEKGKYATWIIPFAVVALIALVLVTAPSKVTTKNSTPVSFSQIQPIILKRCTQCHSSNPTDDVQKIAPNGIAFDTPEQIEKQKDRIMIRVVQTRTMPQANKTGITNEERELIGNWIEQGAKIN